MVSVVYTALGIILHPFISFDLYIFNLQSQLFKRIIIINEGAVSARKAYVKAIHTLPKEFAKTRAYDQGKEMSDHKKFTLATGMKVYFAHPGSPWVRGTNENTNDLSVSIFPKAPTSELFHKRLSGYSVNSMGGHAQPLAT